MNYDIAALKRKMLVKYPFFGSVVASVNYKEDESVGTAATDGETIFYNPKFLESLSVGEQTFIFAHEVCHIAFNHIFRSDGKDSQIWNIATDAVINQFLKRDGLPLVKGGVDIADALNYDAEELYEKMLKEKQKGQSGSGDNESKQGDNQQQQSGQQNGNGGGNSQPQDNGENQDNSEENKDAGHDSHDMWKDAVKKHKEQKNSNKKNKSDKFKDNKEQNQNGNQSNTQNQDDIKKKQEELEKMGEKDAFKKNQEEKKKQLEELRDEIAKQASQAGNTSNGDLRTIDNIGYSKPIVDWRYVLREAIKYEVDWSYQNATIENGVVVPNLEEQPMPETEIVLDTSGSVSSTLLKNFLRECKNILQHSKLKVGCFDTRFYGFKDIRREEDIDSMEFKGGGGTDFDAAVNAFSMRVENKIIFTDGEASMPKKPVDAIWIVYGGRRINPVGGKVIYITNEQLRKLCSFEYDNESKGRSR